MPPGHVDNSKPLKPLSGYALATLAYCARTPTVPSYEGNPGVWSRLMRGGLVEQAPGPRVAYQITAAGRQALAEARG